MPAFPPPDPIDDLNRLKQELVYGYHILGQEGLGRGLLAHLTARLPGSDTFWSYQFGQSVEEVSVHDLREADFDANVVTGDGMVNPTLKTHGILYARRPDVCCIVHHHGDNCVALGAIGANLETFDRNAARFHNDIALIEDYDNAHQIAAQGDAMLSALGNKRALMLQHHGALVTGRTVSDAVISVIELERSAGVQLKAMSAGKLKTMDEGEIADAKEFMNSETFLTGTWNYYKRAIARARPDIALGGGMAADWGGAIAPDNTVIKAVYEE